ncbi:MAG: hypothetical protein JWM33_1073 [Caulobacteraceae bacterium]|nr:hypothetical protein [Caulobacteraceae bacterium]
MRVQRAGVVAAAVAFSLLSACSPKTASPPPAAEASAPTAYGYDIKLSFSPEAAARMKGLNQKITIGNEFYGDATPAAKAKADKGGQLEMGMENTEVEAVDQTVHVTAKTLNLAALPDIIDQKPSVLITVASGPNGANQLSCGVFQDHISVAQTQPVDMHCEAVPPDLVGKN